MSLDFHKSKTDPNKKEEGNLATKLLARSIKQNTQPITPQNSFKRLLIFQFKLFLDALRDLLLSPVSVVATVIDLVEKNNGKQSYFEMLLKIGRESDRRINLFEQHKTIKRAKTVDQVMQQVEEVLIKEYQNGEISNKARVAIEKSLKLKKSKSVNKTE